MGKNHLTKTIHYKKNYYTSNRKSTMEFFYKFLLLTFLFIAINGRPQVWQGQGWQGQSNIGNRDPVHIGALHGGNSGSVGGTHHHGPQGSGQHNYGGQRDPVFIDNLWDGNTGTISGK